jgi:hypothetical protein
VPESSRVIQQTKSQFGALHIWVYCSKGISRCVL